ncbi:GNAT family N-acetyltransferase [Aliikangiella sp. IMCC44359]|uniref:GNAT family N-acetyltransferase n=1 Tax=Aliikangiella sp. IMCC44359 TaxID=3459125 RepID=UPI00403AEB85
MKQLYQFKQNQVLATPTIESERIYLRPCIPSDFAAMYAYRSDPENSRYICVPDTEERVKQVVTEHCEPWKLEEQRWNGLILCEKSQSEALGEFVFRVEDWAHQRAEIGYRLSPGSTGKGYCTEAVKLLVGYIFNNIGFHKVVAKCDPRNIASFKVMEKVGMVKEAYFKEHFLIGEDWTDQLDYGVLRSDWKY